MTQTTLIIARHGNTFEKDETPRRVGLGTDLPLTAAGREQGRRIGAYLKTHSLLPDAVFVSELRRTQETARAALDEAGCACVPQAEALFNELDYGPDENKTEDEVTARIGAQALHDWDAHGLMPPDWAPGTDSITHGWLAFGERIRTAHAGGRVLVVTSNGIARFALHLTGDFAGFRRNHKLKIATGALAILRHADETGWRVEAWNVRP